MEPHTQTQKNVNDSGLLPIGESLMYASLNKFLFLPFQFKHSSVIARLVGWALNFQV